MNKTKVLFVAGRGRSGSTLMGNVLGQLDGYVNCGEIIAMWDASIINRRNCGCGKPVRECEFWAPVLTKAYGRVDDELARHMLNLRGNSMGRWHLPRLSMGIGRDKLLKMSEPYRNELAKLYRAIAEHTQCKVLVDVSKSAAYAYLLDQTPEIDLYTVHLVRDPRAVSYSWWKNAKVATDKHREGEMDLKRRNPIETSLGWDILNTYIDRIWKRENKRYMFLNYETFTKSPRATIESICKFVGEERPTSPFVADDELVMRPCHSCIGNPSRFVEGKTTKIRHDTKWETSIGGGMKLLCNVLTAPCRRRFGY